MSPTVCLTVDFDAVASRQTGERSVDPAGYSRGLFGPQEGVPRLLSLFAEMNVPATWFINGHTVESFPDVSAEVASAGHAIGCHGWDHTSPADFPDEGTERADLTRAVEAIEDYLGTRPTGYRAPHWEFSPWTVGLLQEFDFAWDSSLMEREFTPYWLRRGDRTPTDGPFEFGLPTDIVEIPVSFQRDDWPAFGSGPGQGYVDEAAIFAMWQRQFDWLCTHESDGVYVLTVHPQIIGFSHRIAGLRGLIDHM